MKNIEPRTRLHQNIEKLREEMHCSYKNDPNNINNKITFKLSRRLDKLIIEAMKEYLP